MCLHSEYLYTRWKEGHPLIFFMPVTTKTFHFTSNAEGWTPVISSSNVIYGQRNLNKNRGFSRNLPPVSTIAGALYMTARRNNVSGQNYWELSTTWEALGVPTGHTITTVKLDYLFRWEGKNTGIKPIYWSSAEFSGSNAKAGPAELWDADGSDIIGTFSTSSNCIDRTFNDLWYSYPAGAQAAHPIEQIPMWKKADGQFIDVSQPANSSVDSTPSNSNIVFRVRNTLPTLPDHIYNVSSQWIRFKNDTIVITINSISPSTGTSPIIMFSD